MFKNTAVAIVISLVTILAGCGSTPDNRATVQKKKIKQVALGHCAYSVSTPNTILKKRVVINTKPVRYRDYECLNGKILDRTQACIGLANPWCKANWDALDTGTTEDEVKVLLGSPTRITPYSYKSIWFYPLFSSKVEVSDGKVTGYSKPREQDYFYLGPLKNAPSTTPVNNIVSPCPGLGDAGCKVNWSFLKQGLEKAQVETVLGSPDSIKNVKVISGSVSIDETWVFKPTGEIRFYDGFVVGYDKPESYKYHGGVDN